MKKTVILFLFLSSAICSYSQYRLGYKEREFLSIPNPPYNGYVANANWNVNNSNLTFEEADEAGAIIYPNHYFEGTSLVTCNYRYEYYRNGRYQTGTSSVSYTVSFKAVNAVIDKTELSLNIGQTETIKASFPSGSSISGSPSMTWDSSNEDIVSVSSKSGSTNWTAKIKAEASGSADITFDPVIGPPVTCHVDVAYIDPVSAALSPDPLNVTVGKTKSLKITYSPDGASAKKINWKTADTSVATVNSSGVVKGITEGETTITAETNNGVIANAKVVVLPLPLSVSLPYSMDINLGFANVLKPTVTPENSESTFKWKTSDSSVATVSSGNVKGVKEGSATITVTTENGHTAECIVNVRKTPSGLDYRTISSRVSNIKALANKALN